MGEFKNMLKARNSAKQSQKEYDTLGKAIKERGKKTVKVPHFSDKKTGQLMVDKKRLGRKIPRVLKVYKGRRNRLAGKVGGIAGKVMLAGAALYGGKKLIDDYDASNEKYAGYGSRVADSFSRLTNFRRRSNEVRVSAQKAGNMIKKELKKVKPDKAELGHLNAKKVKETITADRKKSMETAAKFAGPVVAIGSAAYLKKEYDRAHPTRMTHFIR